MNPWIRKSSRTMITLAEFFLLLAVLFVGDYSLGYIKVAPFIVFVAMSYVLLKKPKLQKEEVLSFVLIVLFSVTVAVSSVFNYGDGIYQFWFLIPMLAVLFIKDFLCVDVQRIWVVVIGIAVFLVMIQVFWLTSGGVRGRAVFGPNILYRVFILLAILSYFRLHGSVKNIVFMTCFVGIALTGSRGGLVVGLLTLMAIILSSARWNLKIKYVIPIFVAPLLVYLILLYGDFAKFVLGRLFLMSGGSIDGRLTFIADAAIFFNTGFFDLILGFGVYPNEVLSFYPHNIFVELLISHGMLSTSLFVLVSINVFLYAIFNRRTISRDQRFIFVVLVMFLSSSQFSGGFYDNWVCVSLAFSLFGSFLVNKHGTQI